VDSETYLTTATAAYTFWKFTTSCSRESGQINASHDFYQYHINFFKITMFYSVKLNHYKIWVLSCLFSKLV